MIPEPVAIQRWSRGGLLPEWRKMMEETLDGERLPAPETAVQTKGGAGAGHALPTPVPPVSDGVLIIDRIREHCDALVALADGKEHRRNKILIELRKRKLAPRAWTARTRKVKQ